MPHRQEKISSLLRHLAGEFITREASEASLITVTDAKISADLKNAVVYFTALPEDKEAAALDFLKRKRSDFRDYVKAKSALGSIPHLDFEIDSGEHNRQRIDEISQDIN